MSIQQNKNVLRYADTVDAALQNLLQRYGLTIRLVPDQQNIPGSYWGDEEAGLVGNTLYARADTPLHSILHEACHYICMDPDRRHGLNTDAGGDYEEENAVCYLQILLADQLADFTAEKMCRDMDRWGYTFRLGSAARWFQQDADDAYAWLLKYHLINPAGSPTFRLRDGQTPDQSQKTIKP